MQLSRSNHCRTFSRQVSKKIPTQAFVWHPSSPRPFAATPTWESGKVPITQVHRISPSLPPLPSTLLMSCFPSTCAPRCSTWPQTLQQLQSDKQPSPLLLALPQTPAIPPPGQNTYCITGFNSTARLTSCPQLQGTGRQYTATHCIHTELSTTTGSGVHSPTPCCKVLTRPLRPPRHLRVIRYVDHWSQHVIPRMLVSNTPAAASCQSRRPNIYKARPSSKKPYVVSHCTCTKTKIRRMSANSAYQVETRR